MDNNGYKNSNSEYVENGEFKKNTEELSGLGGWLILVGIGRVLSPIILLWTIIYKMLPILSNGSLDKLSQPGNLGYSNLWRPMILFELCTNIILIIFGVVLLFLFFGKKRAFPKVYIFVLILNVVLLIIDKVLVFKINTTLSINVNSSSSSLAGVIIGCAIWIPYMLTSIRVKNTFVR